MTKINLREHYPNFYKNDCIMTARRPHTAAVHTITMHTIRWIAETALNMTLYLWL